MLRLCSTGPLQKYADNIYTAVLKSKSWKRGISGNLKNWDVSPGKDWKLCQLCSILMFLRLEMALLYCNLYKMYFQILIQ